MATEKQPAVAVYRSYDEMMTETLRGVWGLPPDPRLSPKAFGIEQFFSDPRAFKTGMHDPILLEAVHNPSVDVSEKETIIHVLTRSLFEANENTPLDRKRIGPFLGKLAMIYQDVNTPQELKDFIKQSVTPDKLERILVESCQDKWEADEVQGALEAYCTLQTIEDVVGAEEAKILFPKLARRTLAARSLDQFLEMGAQTVSGEFILVDQEGKEMELTNENQENPALTRVPRGHSIWLGVRGAEAQEVLIQNAYRTVMGKLGTKQRISGYYRNIAVTTNCGDVADDPNEDLLRPDQTLAQQLRVKTEGIRGPNELPLPAKVNNQGEVTISPAPPQVGLHIGPAVGQALKEQLTAQENDTEVMNTVLILGGNGASPHFSRVWQIMAAKRLPVITVIEDNGYAIGVPNADVWGGKQMADMGKGYGVPGIQVEKTEFDKLWLATYFSAHRASYGAGPTNIAVDTVRLGPHSNAHGNNEAAEKILNLINLSETQCVENKILQPYLETLREKLLALSNKSILIGLKDGLSNILSQEKSPLVKALREKIQNEIDAIIDPSQLFLDMASQRGYITADELQQMTLFEKQQMAHIYEDVLKRDRPHPQDHIYVPTYIRRGSRLELPWGEKIQTTGLADEIRMALDEVMKANNNIILLGCDVNKGAAIHSLVGSGKKRWEIIQEGGYWRQTRGLAKKYPRQVFNLPIDEEAAAAMAMGVGLTSTQLEDQALPHIGVVDGQYEDYARRAYGSHKDIGQTRYTTGGLMTRRVLDMASVGMTAGGGTGHVNEDSGLLYTLPYEMEIYYTSTPGTTYQLLRHLFQNGLHTPTILRWDRAMWNQPSEFTLDPDIAPGRAQVVHDGNNIQILTFGPSVRRTLAAIKELNAQDVGVLDIFSLRPLPEDDILKFLQAGSGPIAVLQEDPIGQGFGDILASILYTNPKFKDIAKKRGVHIVASNKVPAIASDGIIQFVNGPKIKEFIREMSEETDIISK